MLLFAEGRPRFGRGPVVGMRIAWEVWGSARRFEGIMLGGGAMSEDGTGLGGGAMKVVEDVLCAEFKAGNEGGGRCSSSSSPSPSPSPSSSELSCEASIKVGMAAPSWALLGATLGVVSGDCEDSACCSSAGAVGAGASNFEPVESRMGFHVDGEWRYIRTDKEMARSVTAMSISWRCREQKKRKPREARQGEKIMILTARQTNHIGSDATPYSSAQPQGYTTSRLPIHPQTPKLITCVHLI